MGTTSIGMWEALGTVEIADVMPVLVQAIVNGPVELWCGVLVVAMWNWLELVSVLWDADVAVGGPCLVVKPGGPIGLIGLWMLSVWHVVVW